MEQMVTVSIKIPRSLKGRIKKSGIKISRVLRQLLEQKTLEEEAQRLNEEAKKHKKILEKLSVEEVVRQIREDRERR